MSVSRLVFVLAGALLVSPVVSGQTAPVVFYPDLTDGPNSGGENNKGAIVTLYGIHFGSTRGSSTVQVGGGLVDNYRIWSDSKIAFQLGPLAQTGNITVTVGGATSNGVAFSVRPGNIYFVSTTGSDTSGTGSATTPWATILKCKNQLAAGDICYVMNGVSQTTIDNYNAGLAIIAEAGGTGTAGYSKALVAYPGATALIGSTTSMGYGVRVDSIHGPANYWTIAGFNLRGSYTAFSFDAVSNIRLVGNNLQCPNGNGATACLDGYQSANLTVLGNEVTNAGVAGASKLYHSVYFSTDTNHVEVGWNNVHDNNSCRGIQFHSSPLSPTTGYNQYDLNVHDNIVHGQVCDGINFATVDPSQGAVRAYNNIIYQVGRGPDPPDGSSEYTCVYVAGGTNTGPAGSGTVAVNNNTFYDCGSRANSDAGAIGRTSSSPALLVSLENNIIYQNPGESYFPASNTSSLVVGSNNLWYGLGAGPAWLAGGVNANPLFVNLAGFDFHLQAGSPAIDAGTAVPVATDFDGVPRPQGSAYDIGAFEFRANSPGPPVSLVSVSVTPSTVVGGSAGSTGSVALSGPAPAGGLSVSLASSNVAASVPAALAIPAGATSATFAIATSSVSVQTAVTISATLGSVTATGTLTLLPAVPVASLSGTSLSMGSQQVGTSGAAQRVTLTDTGTAPLTITTIAITGTNAGDFAQTNTCGSNLAVGANCSISVTFTPSAAGSRSASISITDNAVGSPRAVTLTGTGVAPQLGVNSLVCAPLTVVSGSTSSCTVTLTAATAAATPVTLSSSTPAFSVPASVTVGTGLATAVFAATANTVSSSQSSVITASLNSVSATATLTAQPPPAPPLSFYLHGNRTEIHGTTNGSSVVPTTSPISGSLVIRGTGSLSYSPVINGNGVAFEGVGTQTANNNTAFLSFTGPQVGNLFNPNHGDMTFYVKSSYSFAQRLALPGNNARYVFDVNDGSGELFQFQISAQSNRLGVAWKTGSTSSVGSYYLPVGQEDTLFGLGVVAKFRLTWNGTQNILYWNDVAVAAFSYTKATPTWNAKSSFAIGATSLLFGGGYHASDDAIAEFQMH